jgi:hypothetical protein
MNIISNNPDGSVTVTLSVLDLNTIGAAVWAAKEEGTDSLFNRFFPNGDAPDGITDELFTVHFYTISRELDNAGVDMG